MKIVKLMGILFLASQVIAAEVPKDQIIVRVAHVAPITDSDYGLDSLNGVKMALKDGNNFEIVIDNKKVVFELVSEDDHGDRNKALEAAKRIVMAGDVKVVIGHLSSSTSVFTSTIYASNKIIQISPGATSPVFTAYQSDTTFRAISNDDQQARRLAEFVAKKLDAKKVTILSEKNGYADGFTASFETEMRRNGTGVKAKFTTSQNPMDVLKNIPELIASDADTIVMVGINPAFVPYAKGLRKSGFKGRIVLSDGSCVDDFLNMTSGDGEYYCSRNGMSYENMILWPQFYERFKADFGDTPSVYAGYAYDAAKAFIVSLKASGSLDTKEIAKTMRGADFMGITGTLSFDGAGDRKNAPVSIYAANNGGWQLETSYPAPFDPGPKAVKPSPMR
jgi:branched-chain amino acid transport system substrate-binding protein